GGGAAAAWAAALSRHPPRPLLARSAGPVASNGPVLDELAASALLDRLGIARAPSVALEVGIARAPPLPFAYPVAVKVLCAEIAHKTDVGGVSLLLPDCQALPLPI